MIYLINKHTDVRYEPYPDVISRVITQIDERYEQVIEVIEETANVSGTNVKVNFVKFSIIDKTTELVQCSQKLTSEDMDRQLLILSRLSNQIKKNTNQ